MHNHHCSACGRKWPPRGIEVTEEEASAILGDAYDCDRRDAPPLNEIFDEVLGEQRGQHAWGLWVSDNYANGGMSALTAMLWVTR